MLHDVKKNPQENRKNVLKSQKKILNYENCKYL